MKAVNVAAKHRKLYINSFCIDGIRISVRHEPVGLFSMPVSYRACVLLCLLHSFVFFTPMKCDHMSTTCLGQRTVLKNTVHRAVAHWRGPYLLPALSIFSRHFLYSTERSSGCISWIDYPSTFSVFSTAVLARGIEELAISPVSGD